jgi:hypothetical protein
MKPLLAFFGFATLAAAGCVYREPPPPRERVVERTTVDANGNVIERDTIVEHGPPPPPARVEVVPVAPYPGAIWVGGHWVHYRHRGWIWVGGYWR